MSDDQQQQVAQGNTEAAAAAQDKGQQDNPPAKAEGDAAAAAPTKPADKQSTGAADKGTTEPAVKAAAPAAKKEDAPADKTIELELPEGSKLQPADVDKIASFAKEHGLSKDAAQALLERESAVVQQRDEAALAQLAEQSDAWKQEILADKDFGGEKAAETAQLAHDVAKRFGSEVFVSELERTGLGNHPELVRMLARIGKAMAPDKLRGSGVPPGSQKKSTESKLYAETTPS